MERKPLRSKSVKSAGYDPASAELEIEFATGRVYRYSEVPVSVYEWLLRVANKGSFVSKMVSPCYAYREMPDGRSPRGTAPDQLADVLRASLSQEA
jgi:hypothetical protein